MTNEIIAGRNPVLEALRGHRKIKKILLAKHAQGLHNIRVAAEEAGVPVEMVDRNYLDREAKGARHQGVVAWAAKYEYVSLSEMLAGVRTEDPLIVVLDGVEDPQNLGSILRTSEAVSAHGVVIRRDRAAGVTVATIRAAAGATEHIPVAQVTNISQALQELKTQGLWIIAAEEDAEKDYWDIDLTGAVAVVVGSEGKGLSRLVRKNCDVVVKIPMLGKVRSLNVGVAAALVLYEVRRQRSNLGRA
ncbi:MAG: 23S rRNA (guanosine(2251)-2'-O)-methyltransferase RlmB [Bacillota bacterium]